MMTSESTKSNALPSMIGTMLSKPCAMLMSEIERLTIWPVCSSSCRAPSSRESDVEQLGPQVVLHVERQPPAAIAAQVHAGEVQQRAATSTIASGQTGSVCA